MEEIQKPLGGHLVRGQVKRRRKKPFDFFPATEEGVKRENAPPVVEKQAAVKEDLMELKGQNRPLVTRKEINRMDRYDKGLIKSALLTKLKKLAQSSVAAQTMPNPNFFSRPVNIGPKAVSAFGGSAVQPMRPGTIAVSASKGTALRMPTGFKPVSGMSQNMSKVGELLLAIRAELA